jgi:Family of unknown function (DUF5819)
VRGRTLFESGTRLRARFLKVLPALLVAGLVVHFTFTLAFLTPINPLKLRALPFINGYMVPLFEQRWELFAPDPLVDTRYLLVSCRVKRPDGGLEERPYSNMTAAYRELKHRYRLTPADRLERAQFAPIHMMMGEQDALAKRLLAHPENDTPAFQRAREAIEEDRNERGRAGVQLLHRMASAECDRLYGYGRSKEVRVRMAIVKSPPFSRRELPTEQGEAKYIDFPWGSYVEVAPL